jgi:peptidase E
MITKQIIARGGGGFSKSSSSAHFERYLLQQTAKERPKVCFLPQASNENRDYITHFFELFSQLNTQPSWISLFGRVEPSWRDKLLEQDLIFVGGGNTKSMLAVWREWGMDTALRTAYEQGIILAGSSAGAICWFEQCVTDSVWPLGTIPGLGFLSGSCCPHYDDEPERRPTYMRMSSDQLIMPGIALPAYTAAHYRDGQLQCIVTKEEKKAYYVASGKEEPIVAQYCYV